MTRSYTRRQVLAATAALFGSSLLAGCGGGKAGSAGNAKSSGSTGADSDAKSGKPVVFGAPSDSGTLVELSLIAQRENFIEDELGKVGYYPKYIGFAQAGPAINEGLVSAQIDMTTYGDLPALTALSKGTDVKAIAVVNSAYPFAILASTKSGIKSVGDLKGRRVAAGLGTPTYQFLESELSNNGLSIKDVQLVNTVTDGLTMMASGQLDAVVSNASALYRAEEQGAGTVITTADDGATRSVYMLVGRSEFLDKNPDAAEATVRALRRAYEFVRKNDDQTYKDLVQKEMTEEIQRKVYSDTTFPSFDPEFTDEARKGIEATAKFMKSAGLVDREPDVSKLIDEDYLKKTRS